MGRRPGGDSRSEEGYRHRGAMDDKSSRSARKTSWWGRGRVRSPQEGGGREDGRQREGERKGQREAQGEEEKIPKQGEEEAKGKQYHKWAREGRQEENSSSRSKASCLPVPEHRIRSRSLGETAPPQKGQEDLQRQKQEKEEKVIQQRLRERLQQQREWRKLSTQSSESICRREADRGYSRKDSRSIGLFLAGGVPAISGDSTGPPVGHQQRSSSSHCQALLQGPSDEPTQPSDGKRVYDFGKHRGQTPRRESGLRRGSGRAEIEELGGRESRHSLLHCQPVRAHSDGEVHGGKCTRDTGSSKVSQRRGEDPEQGIQASGTGLQERFPRKRKRRQRQEQDKGQRKGWERQERWQAEGRECERQGTVRKERLEETPMGGVEVEERRLEETPKEGVNKGGNEEETPQAGVAQDGLQTMKEWANEVSEKEQLGSAGSFYERSTPGSGSGSVGVGAVLRKLLDSVTVFRDLGGVLDWCLNVWMRCKSQSIASENVLDSNQVSSGADAKSSPLPFGRWDTVALRALQLLEGHGEDSQDVQTPLNHPSLQKSVRQQLERFEMWDSEKVGCDFEKFFTSKSVDYTGEEVKLAQKLTWEGAKGSLPDGVGALELRNFCSLGTLTYVDEFENYLLPPELRKHVKPPRVMVEEDSWLPLCKGLVEKRVCDVYPLSRIARVNDQPLLSGLFAVGKGEYVGTTETQRVIMNLVPLNSICKNLHSDICALPALSAMSAFLLEDEEALLLSSEDIRCFFYLFATPPSWHPYMGFNKLVPEEAKPPELRGQACVLVSRVLPMGFLNSVGIAQHVHRNIVREAAQQMTPPVGGEHEVRKDKAWPQTSQAYRIYLDNFDVLEKCDVKLASVLQGEPNPQVLATRQAYAQMGLPRHPKKAVSRALRAEVQGAWIMGDVGIAIPKPAKIWQYLLLGLELLARGRSTLRELQVVCGGLVYIALFRRPLLCALNKVWAFMQQMKSEPPVIRHPIPQGVAVELLRFMCMIPLAQINFRTGVQEHVTCSDASTGGGGICVSKGLTDYGLKATSVRGDHYEPHDDIQMLTVGMFDGIGALRVACDLLQLPMAGHISIEADPAARRVVESFFPDTVHHDDVQTVTDEMVQGWALQYSNVGVVLLGSGPPCQGVSGLNSDRRGALRDHRSRLFQEIPKVQARLQKYFPWAQVHSLMESVASMDDADLRAMTEAVGLKPLFIDSFGMSLCHRPRVYWVSWELIETRGVSFHETARGLQVGFTTRPKEQDFLEAGWKLSGDGLPTFTTSRPRATAGRKPAGLHQCLTHEKDRWEADSFRFPPYQYRDIYCVKDLRGNMRIPSLLEREVLMGFPAHYTAACMPKAKQHTVECQDKRLSLIGNSWQVGVVAWLIGQLGSLLGLIPATPAEEILARLVPGQANTLQGLLLRPALHKRKPQSHPGGGLLVRKLQGLVSIKGEDLLVQAASEPLVKFHRLRTSMPGQLWHWKDVASWGWRTGGDHINVLELRAILTTVKWWVFKRRIRSQRVIHLTDSLVCLHALSRGRSSSRKLRRTLIRINCLLLASDLHFSWGYIHTSQNPADRPSRRYRFVKKRWVK